MINIKIRKKGKTVGRPSKEEKALERLYNFANEGFEEIDKMQYDMATKGVGSMMIPEIRSKKEQKRLHKSIKSKPRDFKS